jgi:hypothetical protein
MALLLSAADGVADHVQQFLPEAVILRYGETDRAWCHLAP